METRALTSILYSLGYDPKPFLPRIIQIGDKTACRLDKDSKKLVRANYERASLLHGLVTHYGLRSFLEFGTGRGFSCGCLADFGNLGNIVTVDYRASKPVKKLLRQCGVNSDRIQFLTKNSKDLVQSDVTNKFDLVLIDAQHDGEAVDRDLAFALSVLDKRGIIVFDDYNEEFHSVQQSILRAVAEGLFDQAVMVMTDGWLIDERIVGDEKPYRQREINTGMVVAAIGYKIPD